MIEKSELTLSWSGVEDAIGRAAPGLMAYNFERILMITRGGLVPGALLADALNIRDLDCICVSSYDDKIKRDAKNISVMRAPLQAEFNNTKTLVIDDIADTGTTMSVIAKLYPYANRLVLVAKPRGVQFVGGYITGCNQNTWVNFPWENVQKKGAPLHPIGGEELPS